MKKLYIQPALRIESIMATLGMLAGSQDKGNVISSGFDENANNNNPAYDIDTKLHGGDGTDFAKHRGFFDEEDY